MKNNIIEVQDIRINITNINEKDYICISDIAKAKSDNSRAADVIRNWLRNRSTLDFLTTWEQLYNPNFKVFESEHFRKQVGLLTFTPSVREWCDITNAIGIYSKLGKYGGTYAHKDIAFEFASAISPVFKLYLIKEFERLKELENQNREWDVKRILTRNNYLIHTDAIKNYILPDNNYYKNKEWIKYAEEADILNVVVFNTTAKNWRELNPNFAKTSNVRDYATINELTVLSNLESHNAELIKEGKSKEERFEILNSIAKYQLDILNNAEKIKQLKVSNNNSENLEGNELIINNM
ncbi:MAG: KilA-N domain-containing protein [Bacilli bacterium]